MTIKSTFRWQILSLVYPLKYHVTLLPKARAKMAGMVKKVYYLVPFTHAQNTRYVES